MSLRITIPGEPQGKARPRVVRTNSGRSMSYTPDKTVAYEELVRVIYLGSGGKKWADDVPLSVTVTAYYSIPKSATKKRRQAMMDGHIHPTKKPDCDNIAKIICDALNGIAYRDDAQVTELHVLKRFSTQPEVTVQIGAVGE